MAAAGGGKAYVYGIGTMLGQYLEHEEDLRDVYYACEVRVRARLLGSRRARCEDQLMLR